MPKEFSRALRLAEQIHRDLSVLISRELKDPRVGMVTIGEVEVSPDLSHAKIYYTVMGELGDPEATQEGLERAKGFLRSRLGKGLRVRFTPELHFIYDKTEENSSKLEALIAKARARDEQGTE
jgi:ribosome-binding factor A